MLHEVKENNMKVLELLAKIVLFTLIVSYPFVMAYGHSLIPEHLVKTC
jgi:hypothetical protein